MACAFLWDFIRAASWLLIAFYVFHSPALAAGSELSSILASHVLRVGTTGDYRPFTMLERNAGEYSGLDIDLARSLGRALGATVEFVPTTWASLADDLKGDAFDIAMGGISVTLDRQKTGFFSAPYLRDGKTAIARCVDKAGYQTLADIDRPEVRVITNRGGTNERFDRARLHQASIIVYPDNVTIFDHLAEGDADVMITDASEARLQEKLHPNVLCAIHPEKPFEYGEKAYWMAPDPALKAFVDQWLHLAIEDGEFDELYAKWFR
jgi:cyclohexadienyl dehydratase